ncbi:MAG: serine/threonine-protein kinase [uncultured bacterium]|nr:MAG: serine/threonine-protein kinase [uncultured bacterium]
MFAKDVKIINPTSMKLEEAHLLGVMLKQCEEKDIKIFHTNNEYAVNIPSASLFGSSIKYIKLTHDLVHRYHINPVTKRVENRFSIVNFSQELAKGAFGNVYEVIGTVALQDSDRVIVKTDKPRVIKVQEYKDDKSLRAIELEAEISQLTNHLHIKIPTQFEHKVYLVLKRFLGKRLDKMLDDDEDVISSFSIEFRIKLTIQLLKALKQQVHDKEIIHRDIKPANIYINKFPLMVNIFDFGLSRRKDVHDQKICGTIYFLAPEGPLKTAELDEVSDIYSMGLILAMLWRGTTKSLQEGEVEWKTVDNLLRDLTLDGKISEKIVNNIMAMISKERSKRPSLEIAISEFEKIYEEYLHSQNKDFIFKAYQISNDFNDTMYHKSYIRTTKQFQEFLKKYINQLPNDPETLNEFSGIAQVYTFFGKKNATEIINIINDCYSLYDKYNAEIQSLRLEVEKKITCLNKFFPIKEISSAIKNLILIDENVKLIEYKLIKNQFNLDNLVVLLEHIHEIINQIHLELNKQNNLLINDKSGIYSIIQRLDLQATQDIDVKFKIAINNALADYLIKTLGSPSILSNQTLSTRRLNDINKILDIINKDADVDELISEVEAKINSLETGLTGNSTLRILIENAISDFKVNSLSFKNNYNNN